MCVIIVSRTELPDRELLHDAEMLNRDGAGVAWFEGVEGTTVRYVKGLDAEGVLRLFEETPPPLPIVTHFRKATSGGTCKALTHPFPISRNASTSLKGRARAVLFHNGSVTEWKNLALRIALGRGVKLPQGPLSDTRIIAWAMYFLGDNLLELLPGKFALMKDGEVITYGRFLKHGAHEISSPVDARPFLKKGDIYTPWDWFYEKRK